MPRVQLFLTSRHQSFNNPWLETWTIRLSQLSLPIRSLSSLILKACTVTAADRLMEGTHLAISLEHRLFHRIPALVNNLPLMLKNSRSTKRDCNSFMNNRRPSKSRRWTAPFSEMKKNTQQSLTNPSWTSETERQEIIKTFEFFVV
jgi:hypothetical protein